MTLHGRRVTSALFVDFDNAYSALDLVEHSLAQAFVQDGVTWLERLRDGSDEDGPFTRRFLQRSVYLNPAVFGPQRRPLTQAGFRVVDCPSLTKTGKSSADMWMALDILDALAHPTRFDEFVIISSDSDFAPILHRIRAFDRKATIVTIGYAAAPYRASADHVIDGAQFARILGSGGDEPGATPMPSVALLEHATVDHEAEAASTDASTEVPMETASQEALRLGAAQAIADLVIAASGPVPAATAAHAARKVDPSLPSTKWEGRGFLGWVAANLEGVDSQSTPSSPGYIWDASRFDAPSTSQPLTPLQVQVASVTDVPRLTEEQYASLHNALAKAISSSGLTMAGTPLQVRELLAKTHPPVSVRAITEVVRGMRLYVQDRLSGTTEPAEIAKLWADLVISLAEGAGVDLSDEDRFALRKWLGGGLAQS